MKNMIHGPCGELNESSPTTVRLKTQLNALDRNSNPFINLYQWKKFRSVCASILLLNSYLSFSLSSDISTDRIKIGVSFGYIFVCLQKNAHSGSGKWS